MSVVWRVVVRPMSVVWRGGGEAHVCGGVGVRPMCVEG